MSTIHIPLFQSPLTLVIRHVRMQHTTIVPPAHANPVIQAVIIVMEGRAQIALNALLGSFIMGPIVQVVTLLVQFVMELRIQLVIIACRLIISLMILVFHVILPLFKVMNTLGIAHIHANPLENTSIQTAPATPHATPDSTQPPNTPRLSVIFPVQAAAKLFTMTVIA